jgi:hypothetical protein
MTKSFPFNSICFGLGFLFSVLAANGEVNSYSRTSANLSQRSVSHQNDIRGMKQDLNDYGGQVYDLRVRFDRIFKNRETNVSPSLPFDIGPESTLPDLQNRSARSNSRVVSNGSRDGASPLAMVVDGPNRKVSSQPDKVSGSERTDVDGGKKKPDISRRKFEYYVLPRLGLGFPTDGDYDTGLSFATSAGLVRGNWRFGVDFTYSSNESSMTRMISGFAHNGHGETSAYGLLLQANRDVPLGGGWIGSVGLGLGGGWSVADQTILVNWEEREGGFAWQLGLGARRPFGETSSLFLGYRYLGHPTVPAHNLEIGAEVGF